MLLPVAFHSRRKLAQTAGRSTCPLGWNPQDDSFVHHQFRDPESFSIGNVLRGADLDLRRGVFKHYRV